MKAHSRTWLGLGVAALVAAGIYSSLDSPSSPTPPTRLETRNRLKAPDELPAPSETDAVNRHRATTATAIENETDTLSAEALREARTPMRLYRDARVQPVYDLATNRVRGVRILDVEPDSFWAEIGVHSQDVILEFNGTLIETPASTVSLMNAVAQDSGLSLRLRSPDGEERFAEYRAPR